MDKLEGFASFYGAAFYGMERNPGKITLVRKEWEVPAEYPFGDTIVVPFFATKTLGWALQPPAGAQ